MSFHNFLFYPMKGIKIDLVKKLKKLLKENNK